MALLSGHQHRLGIDDHKFAHLAEYATSPLYTPLERLVLVYGRFNHAFRVEGQDFCRLPR